MRYRGGWEITPTPLPVLLPGKKEVPFRSLIRLDSKEEVSRVEETRWILIERRHRKKSFVYDIRGNFADPYFIYSPGKRNARYFVSRYTLSYFRSIIKNHRFFETSIFLFLLSEKYSLSVPR